MVVIVDENFFVQLPKLKDVDEVNADIAWMIYSFRYDRKLGRNVLVRKEVKYTEFENALEAITIPLIGDMSEFMGYLKNRIRNGKTMGVPEYSGLAPEVEPPPDILEHG